MLSSSKSASSRCSWRSPRKIESGGGDRPSATRLLLILLLLQYAGKRERGKREGVYSLPFPLFIPTLLSVFRPDIEHRFVCREKATGARREEEEGDKRGGKKTLSVIFFLSVSPSRRPTPLLLFRQGKRRGWRGNRHARCGIRQWKMPRQEGKGHVKKEELSVKQW